jgi:hypothetical protein
VEGRRDAQAQRLFEALVRDGEAPHANPVLVRDRLDARGDGKGLVGVELGDEGGELLPDLREVLGVGGEVAEDIGRDDTGVGDAREEGRERELKRNQIRKGRSTQHSCAPG